MSNVLPPAPNRFFLPFGIFENQPDPGSAADVAMVASALSMLVPTFDSVAEMLENRSPEFAVDEIQPIRVEVRAEEAIETIYLGVVKATANTIEFRTQSLMKLFRMVGIEPFENLKVMEERVAEMEAKPFSERGLPPAFEARGNSVASRPVAVTVSFVDNRVLN